MNKGTTHNPNQYRMNTYDGTRTPLETVESEKDIGVTIDKHLSYGKHMQTQINKANQIVGLTRRSFKHLDNRTFTLLFKALVRPHLEYASSVWSPYKISDIISIENVQKRATKMLPSMKELSYERRLRLLKLPSLRFRRMRGDMIEVFKILKGLYDNTVTSDLLELSHNTQTRGNLLKLEKKPRCIPRCSNCATLSLNCILTTWIIKQLHTMIFLPLIYIHPPSIYRKNHLQTSF